MGASDLSQPFFILSPICIHIYNELNIGLALYCVIEIVNVNYPIDDPENVIQGDFILSPFSIRQNIGLNRGTDYKIVVSILAILKTFSFCSLE